MNKKKFAKRKVVQSLAEIPQFASEDEEREWRATHEPAEELGKEVSAEQHELIRRLTAKYQYLPAADRKTKAA